MRICYSRSQDSRSSLLVIPDEGHVGTAGVLYAWRPASPVQVHSNCRNNMYSHYTEIIQPLRITFWSRLQWLL